MIRLLRLCLLTAVATHATCQEHATSHQWLEWRGGAQQGHSATRDLPTELDPNGANLHWRAEVRGRGISSPIVVGERVFVTTAHRHDGPLRRLRSVAMGSLSCLTVLAGLVVALRWRPRRPTQPDGRAPNRLSTWLARIDQLATTLLTACFVWLGLTAHFAPDQLWTLGRPGEGWLVTGKIVMLGLAAASGWARSGGRLRMIMTAVLVAVGVLLWHGVPYDRYGIEHGAWPRAMMLAPGLGFALWSLLTWRATSRDTSQLARHDRAVMPAVGGVSVATAALVLYLSVNSTSEDQLARTLVCLDLESGAQLWDRVIDVSPKEAKWPTNSYATPTPCSDGERVFAYFGGGWGCVDLDGNVLWTGSDPDYLPASRYGAGASPIFAGEQILLWQENEAVKRASYIQSFDARTGASNWRVEPDDLHDSYSTPILLPRADGSVELVSMSYKKLVAHSIADGRRLWEVALPSRQPIPSLCYAGDDLLLVSGGTHLGFSTSGIRLHGQGSETRPEVVWQTRRNLAEICSPVLVGGHFFTIIDGRMRCIDPVTGKVHWTGRASAGDYWASLVAGDDKIYAVSGDGEVTTIAVDPTEMRILAETSLEEDCMATPAIAAGRVIVRTESYVFCFGAPRTRVE